MKELEYIKRYIKNQFDKYRDVELGFRYEYDSITNTHIVEVSNENIYTQDDFCSEAFDFAMEFISNYNEVIMFIKPGDPIKMSHIDYSENNFDKKQDYIFGTNNIDSLRNTIFFSIEENNEKSYSKGNTVGFQSPIGAAINAEYNEYDLAA
jgi:hypothetical protein